MHGGSDVMLALAVVAAEALTYLLWGVRRALDNWARHRNGETDILVVHGVGSVLAVAAAVGFFFAGSPVTGVAEILVAAYLGAVFALMVAWEFRRPFEYVQRGRQWVRQPQARRGRARGRW